MKSQLLDDLADALGVYISRLHEPGLQDRMLDTLSRFLQKPYSMEEWNYCLGYLYPLHEKFAIETKEEAEAFLRSLRPGR